MRPIDTSRFQTGVQAGSTHEPELNLAGAVFGDGGIVSDVLLPGETVSG